MKTTHPPVRAGLLGHVFLVCLCCYYTSAFSQIPTITVRFANPIYNCSNGQYCLDVEFRADTVGVELFGMNVRFFYPDTLLELDSFAQFQGGYSAVAPDPPAVMMGLGELLNFPGDSADFVNGAVQLTDPNIPPIILDTLVWTKIFAICFTVEDPDQDLLCPPIVWDLKENPADGGFLAGDDGVVLTIVDASNVMESLPSIENVVQWNWVYNMTDPNHFGMPVSMTCTSLDCSPDLLCAVDTTIQCNTSINPLSTGFATATDNCAGDPVITFTDSIILGNCPNNFIIQRTWIAINACNLSDTCIQLITIVDTTAPSIMCPANTTVQCANLIPPANPGLVLASDNCSGSASIVFVGDQISNQVCANRFIVSRTYRAIDACGNSASCTQTITVFDSTPPAITCPQNVTVMCASQVPIPNPALVLTTDNCGGVASVSFENDVISNQTCANRFTITRTYRATDLCGNTATCSHLILVNDQTVPVITCPPPVTVQCSGEVPAPNTALVITSDNCGTIASVLFVNDVTSNQTCANRFIISRTYRAIDACGNSSTCSQTIVVNDQTPPTITCPQNSTVSCASLVPPANTGAPTATDNCGEPVSITFVSDVTSNLTCANRFTVTRTYRATDVCGNSATCAQTITVNDQIPPSITCPVNTTVSCASQIPGVNIGAPTATDNCGGGVIPSFVSDVVINQTCANRLTLLRTYRATDFCGNSATCTQIITVNDQVPPSITCPQNVTVMCANLVPPVNPALVVTSDNCGGGASVTFVNDAISNQTCANRFTITRTYRATDVCGNSATCSQTIVVNDQTPPAIQCPVNITVECAGSVPAPNTATVVASDNCGAIASVLFVSDVISNQSCVNRFTITRTYSATDICGNTATCSQTILVNDQIPPTIACPQNITVSCTSEIPVVNTTAPTASDNCGGTVAVGFINDRIVNQTCANRYTLLRTYQASDLCGNTATCVQTILVNDIIPPSITCPTNLSVSCASLVPSPNNGAPTASDNCSAGATVGFVNDLVINQTCANRFTVLRTYRATDLCGNSATCTQTIIVNDLIPPSITCPQNVTVMCANMVPPVNPATVTTSDNCGGSAPVIFENDIISNMSCANRFTITRTYRATDLCGNTATCSQLIVVNDQTPPSILCPASVTVQCSNEVLPANPASVVTSDNCGGIATVTFDNDVISNMTCTNRFTIARTYHATDACGNSASCTQIIMVNDTTPPDITCPVNMTISVESDTSPQSTGAATGTDNCLNIPVLSFGDVTIEGFCEDAYQIIRTWTAVDDCNNSATCIQTIEVTGSCTVDLSLLKELDAGQGVVKGGDNVNFTITVTNEGQVVISQVTITDYIPTGFALNDPDWTPGTAGSSGQSASIVLTDGAGVLGADGLIPGESVSVAITLIANPGITSGVYINLAEISTIIDDNGNDVSTADVDSDADSNDVNDPPGEDDRDPALICVVDPVIVGPPIVCPGDTIVYGLLDFNGSSILTWALENGGGVITSTTDSTVTIAWQSTPGGPFLLTVTELVDVGCSDIDTFEVVIQGADPIACIDHINLSIDNECGTIVTSGMILVGEQAGDNNYTVIIKDLNGNIIPNATFTYEHVGQTFYVMVLSECSGNSCWATVTVEDKFAPIINCVCPVDSGDSTCNITCRDIPQFLAGNITPELRPEVIDNCGGASLVIVNTVLNFDYCVNGTLEVTWLATDASGNSSTCQQVFGIVPLTLATLTFPPEYIGVCHGSSDPSVTGVPQVDGINLDLVAGVCNLVVTYKDLVIQLCGGGIKILRTWTVRDWCTGDVSVFQQAIWLADHEAPVLTCTGDITVSTNLWNCFADVILKRPVAIDSCSNVTGFQLFSPDGTVVTAGNKMIINGLLEGIHPVTWVVTDECGNTSTCGFNITVVDEVPPVVSCQSQTIVSLTSERSNGITLVPASAFNDGSFDNCGPVSFRARRMDSCIDFDWTTGGACVDEIPGGIPAINGFDLGTERTTCVPFGCCDVGRGPIMVELEVSDASGNVNYCMVEIEVQDKLAPSVDCPPDIIISCEYLLDIQEGIFTDAGGNNNGSLDEDPLSAIFGNVYDAFSHQLTDRKSIIINDPHNTNYPQPHNFGVDGWAYDNCEVDLQVTVIEFDDCSGASFPANAPAGARKLIQRRFRAYDGVTAGTCLQRIWVVDFDPFFITDSTCLNANPNDGVIWPCDVLLTTCPSDLTGTGEPVILDDACSLIGISSEDRRFDFADSACYKVLRDWQVIDWCQFNTATGEGRWTYTQVIKVMDGISPDFVSCPAGAVSLCTDDPGVTIPANNQIFLGENNPNATSCSVHVAMTQHIHEDCSEMIFYDVKYYPFNGSSFIQVVPVTATTLNANHEVDITFNTLQSTILSIQQNGLPYNSPLCGDSHRIVWTVEDGCGNGSSCDYLFRLEDCKDPTPVLIDGISSVLMGANGQVTLTASSFDASSNDDCTPGDELLFSFSGTSYQPTFTYTCDNVPEFGEEFEVSIWVGDGGSDQNCNGQIEWSERNKAFSTTTLVITDNNNVCGQLQSGLAGEILTDHQEAVENVIVNLTSPAQVFPAYTTSGDGKFVFSNLPIGSDYTITPARNDDYKNGVSTMDLVGIQKHLLGIEGFTSPYQYIAADANNSRNVSALDLLEIRKLILGIIPAFANNDSWRFLDKNTVFPDPDNPWLFNENLFIQHYTGESTQNDFVAVKVGDINNSVKANALQVLPREGRRILEVNAETKETAKAGEVIEVKLTLPEVVSGFQWTLETDGLEYVGVTSGDIQIDDVNVGILGNGVNTMSWNGDVLAFGGYKSEVNIIMRWKVMTGGKIKNRFRLTSLVTAAESYTPSGEILDVKMSFGDAPPATDFNLYQNKPNPWNGQTTIGFDLPEDGPAKLTVYDVTGRVIASFDKDFAAGYNTIILTEKEIHSWGVLYYRLESGKNSASRKMVLIR